MTWTRLSDDFTDRPEVVRPGRSARFLHVEALVWCNRQLTDGALPDHMVARITDSADVDRDVAELADTGLWTRLPSGDGWQVDWTDQETAEVVKDRKEANAARQRLFNERRRLHARGDHSICHPMGCEVLRRNASPNASVTPSVTGPPSRPVPSRPLGRDGTEDREGGSTSSDGGSAGAPPAASSAPPPGVPGPPPGAGSITVNGIPVNGPGAERRRAAR